VEKILVTGAAGFIGSFLTQRLLKEGYQVIGIDNLFRGKESNLKPFIDNRNFKFVKADVTKDIPDQLFENVDAVFHYAAINGTAHFYERPLEVLSVNVEGTINILKTAARHKVKKFVFASSSEVYGEPQCFPTDENQPIVLPNVYNPRYSYAASKAIGEYYVNWYAKKSGMTAFIFRIFNTYGPRMDTSGYGQVVPEFARKMFYDKEFTIIGTGDQTRSFCYIDDNIELAIRAFKSNEGDTLNIGNNDEVTILKLAELMHKIEGKIFQYKLLPPLDGDHNRRLPDIHRVVQRTGYKPVVGLEKGLKLSLDFWRNGL
jgi:nucleoside-diphosphate-sugar epimerase